MESGTWTVETGPLINEPAATHCVIAKSADALSLVMCEPEIPYAGWLAKHVQNIPNFPAKELCFSYNLLIDYATTVFAQVIETDVKATNKAGYTYDMSFQINIAKGWMLQVGNPWIDTGIQIKPLVPCVLSDVMLEFNLDVANARSKLVLASFDGISYEIPEIWIPAMKEGWEANQLVFQLQQVTNSKAGGYTLNFRDLACEFV
jgi:hypothetical protein